MTDKVLAYITRPGDGAWQLLVFTHRNRPEAGTQVPAGTVEPNETMESALWREVEEESGLRKEQLRLTGKLAEYESATWNTRRHVFHLELEGEISDSWSRAVTGSGEDQGLTFDFRWITISPDLELAGSQHAWLGLLPRP